MSRDTSPYIVGDFWLDKRRDGKSPQIWQIASYDPKTRSIGYTSTRRREVGDARPIIDAHHARAQAEGPQRAEDALVVPLLLLFWREKGSKAQRPDTVASSLRAFIGFLMQDKLDVTVTVAELRPMVFERFLAWRMGPHAWDLEWEGKRYKWRSEGVVGESVQRNLDDVRWALGYQADNGRIPYAPKIAAVPEEERSDPRDRVLSYDELGAIIGFASSPIQLTDGSLGPPDTRMRRHVLLLLGTGMRPEAAMQIDPAKQYDQKARLLDTHPPGAPRTKKRNAVVPVIDQLHPVLVEWAADGAKPVASNRTSWTTLRKALGLGEDVVQKTIRHTVSTRLRQMGVPGEDISGLLSHRAHSRMSRTSEVYAKYDPKYLAKAKRALAKIWTESMKAADRWSAGHLRAKVGNGKTIVVDMKDRKAQITKA